MFVLQMTNDYYPFLLDNNGFAIIHPLLKKVWFVEKKCKLLHWVWFSRGCILLVYIPCLPILAAASINIIIMNWKIMFKFVISLLI